MGLFCFLVAPGVNWRTGTFPWGRAAQQSQLLVLKPHLGASSEMGRRQEGLNLQRFGDCAINVANNELCSCGVYLRREPGGSFYLLTKEQVLQRKPISETFSKIPKIFSGAAASKQREGRKPNTKPTWLYNKQTKAVPEVVVCRGL